MTLRRIFMSEKRIAHHLSVVIPTLGRDCLRGSVRAIATGTVLPAEIVLSHQGPVGAMNDMLREFEQFGVKIRYIHSNQRGAAAGRNTGLRQVTTPCFATTDDDCNVAPAWLEEIDRALTEHPKHVITGRVLASEPGAPSVITSDAMRVYTRVPLDGGHFSGGNFGAAIAVYNDVGPFDESELLRYCEDPEWAYRALAKGYPIRFIPAVTVTHLHWRDDQDMAKVFRQYAHSQGGWFGRRLRQRDLSFVIRLGYELARGAKRWCVGSLTGDRQRKVNGRAFVLDLLRGVAAGWNGQ
jgi:GT2 family glycosyltransferase